MDSAKYSKNIVLKCPTCGGTNFKFDSEIEESAQIVTCSGCNAEFSRKELIQRNQHNINNTVDAVKKEVVKDITKEIQNIFNKIGR